MHAGGLGDGFGCGLALGFGVALSPGVLLYAFVGCVVGTLVGVLPGVGPFDPLDWGLGFELKDDLGYAYVVWVVLAVVLLVFLRGVEGNGFPQTGRLIGINTGPALAFDEQTAREECPKTTPSDRNVRTGGIR